MQDRLFWHRTADLRAKLVLGVPNGSAKHQLGESIENTMFFCSCPLALRRETVFAPLQRVCVAKAPKSAFSRWSVGTRSLQTMSLEQFFAMGGYAFYVWTAYAVAFAVLVFNLILPLRRKTEVHKSIERLFKLERPRP